MITLDNSQYLPLIEEGDLKNVSVVVAGDLQTLFSVKLDPSQLQQQNNGGEENSSELYMIPILKEVKEDLSVKDICSMVGVEQQVEEPPSLASVQASTAKETIAKPKKKKKPAQKSPQQQQLSKGQLPPPQQQTKDPLDDDNLLFSCCDKCFHSFRTQERFDSHKCTAKGGGKVLYQFISFLFGLLTIFYSTDLNPHKGQLWPPQNEKVRLRSLLRRVQKPRQDLVPFEAM